MNTVEFGNNTPQQGSSKGSQSNNVAAVIVLFHPEVKLLERLLEGISAQVERVILVDNTPGFRHLDQHRIQGIPSNLEYMPLGENRGVAEAQNVGMTAAFTADFTHVVLFDQDSAVPDSMVKALMDAERALTSAGMKVAAIGPVFIDEKTGTKTVKAVRLSFLRMRRLAVCGEIPVQSDYIISSGSLISKTAILDIGLMRADLFIDWVDIEWGLRAQSLGYCNFICPLIEMQHSVGDEFTKILGREFYLHSDIRNYYIVRNAVHLVISEPRMGWQWRIITAAKIPTYVAMYPLLSKTPGKAFSLLLRALRDGFQGRLGRLD
jgi:rhamnosyltransferase